MIIHKEGGVSRALCEQCGMVVPTTFRYAEFDAIGVRVPEVLQGFCDICGDAVSLPHQSTFRIREYRESRNHQVEFRVPLHFTDILLAIGSIHKISRKPNLLCRLISELYLTKMIRPEGLALRRKIIRGIDDELATGKSKDRLSCVFPELTYSALKTVSGDEHKSTSDIVRGIIVTAKHDFLDKKDQRLGREFEDLAAARL